MACLHPSSFLNSFLLPFTPYTFYTSSPLSADHFRQCFTQGNVSVVYGCPYTTDDNADMAQKKKRKK